MSLFDKLKQLFSTFHALCLSAIFTVFILLTFKFIPQQIYYLLWQTNFIFLAIAIILSVYFNKSKLFTLLSIPLFFNVVLAFPTVLFSKLSGTAFWSVAPLSCSIGFLLLYLPQERGLFSSFGILRTTVAAMILTLSYCGLNYFSPEIQKALASPFLPAFVHTIFKANDISIALSSLTLFMLSMISCLFDAHTQKAPIWMFLGLMLSFLVIQDAHSFILFSFVSSLIAITALIKDAYKMAYIDTLTQVPNRRALEDRFLHLGSHYFIAMVDIDFFKKFNDKFGHDIGDEVLKMIAKELSLIKNGGMVYRYGGEEFTIVFQTKQKEECIMALEEVRERIFRRGFVIRGKNRPAEAPKTVEKTSTTKKERLSVSIGMAKSLKGKLPHDIVKLADEALYKAKESGRNCLITS